MRPLIRRSAALFVVCLVAAECSLTAAEPAADLRKEMANLALAVKQELAPVTTVSLGRFEGAEAIPSGAGAGMAQMMTEELTKAGLAVTDKAEAVIRGRFSMTKSTLPDEPASLRIQMEVVDAQQRAIVAVNRQARLAADVKGDAVVTAALGVTGSIPADGTPAERADRIRDNLANPPGHIVGGTRFCSDAASPYQVEVLVDGAPLPVGIEKQLGQCDIPLGKAYVINLYNNSEYDAAVRVAIDGVDVFHFSELRHADGPKKGQPLYDSYIIPSKRFIQLKGWHKTNQNVNSFLVGELAQGAAAAAKLAAAQGKIGMITCQYSAAWDPNGAPPPDEPSPKKGVPRATTQGPPLKEVVAEVKRNIGVLRATIALRYDK